MKILYLYESPLPHFFDDKTLSPGEVRVVAAQDDVKKVWVLGPMGNSFYELKHKGQKTRLEEKVELFRFKWLNNIYGYYLTWIPLTFFSLRLIYKEKIDLIQAESPHISGIAAFILGIITHKPYIVEYRASYDSILTFRYGNKLSKVFKWVFWKVTKPIFAKANAVAANSRTYAQYLRNKKVNEKIDFFNPGIKEPKIITKKPSKNIIIGFLGRLYPDKGVMDLVDLIVNFKNDYRKMRVRLLIGGVGPLYPTILDAIKSNKIEDLVTMKGTINRWDFLNQINILVNPNKILNALEMVNVEAAFLGIPVVTYGNSTYPETVQHGETGLIVDKHMQLALKQAIDSLINNEVDLNPDKMRKLAQKYMFEVQVKNYARILSVASKR